MRANCYRFDAAHGAKPVQRRRVIDSNLCANVERVAKGQSAGKAIDKNASILLLERLEEMTVADAYKEILMRELPHAIHSEAEYEEYLQCAKELIDRRDRSEAEDRYLELVSILIERFEDEDDTIDAADPIVALKELMAVNGVTQAELSKLLGSSGNTSEILASKRSLSKAHIKTLAERFNVSPALFV